MKDSIRRFFGNLSIRKKITLIVMGMTCVFAAILTVYYYTVSATTIRINAERQMKSTLNMAVESLDSDISAVESILYDTSINTYLQELLRQAEQKTGDEDFADWKVTEEIRNLLMVEGTKLSEIQGFYVVDTKNRVYAVKNLRYDFDIHLVDWQKLREAKGKSVWGAPQQGHILFGNGEAPAVIPVGKTIYHLSTHTILGYVIVFLDTEYLEKVTEGIHFSGDDQIFLINKMGDTIPENIEKEVLSLPFHPYEFQKVHFQGIDQRTALWPSGSEAWNIALVTQTEENNDELLRLRQTTFGILALMGVIAIIVSKALARSISRPILLLVSDMQKFSKGDFTVQVTARYDDEIGVLRRNFNRLVNDINHLVNDVYHEKMLKQQAQLKMLQMQINPHFLYNTLDTINWLAQSHGASDVAEVSQSLGVLMRFSLAEQELIPLEQELDAVEHYMVIQHYRYGEQLQIVMDVKEEALYEKIPRHMILPLIENAVEHGFKGVVGEKRIMVTGRIEGNVMVIQVADNGKGMTKLEVERVVDSLEQRSDNRPIRNGHHSIGLRNVNQRIRLRYGETYGLRLTSIPGEGTAVYIEIPCEIQMEDLSKE